MANSKTKDKKTDTDSIDFGAISQKVQATGKRGRPSSVQVKPEALDIVKQWIESDSKTLPFSAFQEQFGDLVKVEGKEDEMMAKARGEMSATEAADTTEKQGKIAKLLRDVVKGKAEVRPLDFDGEATFGLVKRLSNNETE